MREAGRGAERLVNPRPLAVEMHARGGGRRRLMIISGGRPQRAVCATVCAALPRPAGVNSCYACQ